MGHTRLPSHLYPVIVNKLTVQFTELDWHVVPFSYINYYTSLHLNSLETNRFSIIHLYDLHIYMQKLLPNIYLEFCQLRAFLRPLKIHIINLISALFSLFSTLWTMRSLRSNFAFVLCTFSCYRSSGDDKKNTESKWERESATESGRTGCKKSTRDG